MHRIMLVSKIHRAVTQEVNLQYEGSIAIDEDILAAADVFPYQQVQVYNLNTGARFETYTRKIERQSTNPRSYSSTSRTGSPRHCDPNLHRSAPPCPIHPVLIIGTLRRGVPALIGHFS